jgi:hypothetical protein
MKAHKRRIPGVFQWIRTARDKINRETEGMTPEEWCAYMRSSAEIARKNRIPHIQEEAEREPRTVSYVDTRQTRTRTPKAKRGSGQGKVAAKRLAHA